MKKKSKKEKDFARLTPTEKKIYYSLIQNFPATSHDSAMDKALQGGVRWQFYPK